MTTTKTPKPASQLKVLSAVITLSGADAAGNARYSAVLCRGGVAKTRLSDQTEEDVRKALDGFLEQTRAAAAIAPKAEVAA